MRERLPNAHFPVKGVLASSEEAGSRQLNIKSEKRKLKTHTKSIDYLKNGRTPFVVTSESPGPAEYVSQPDFSFLPPPSPLVKPTNKRKQANTVIKNNESEEVLEKNEEAKKEVIADKDIIDTNKTEEVFKDQKKEKKVGVEKEEILVNESGDESSDGGWSSSDEVQVEDIVLDKDDIVIDKTTKKWTKEELNLLWSKYDNNASGQVSFAEIEKAIIEYFPELDNKEVMRQ